MKTTGILASLALAAAMIGCGDEKSETTKNSAPVDTVQAEAVAETVPEFFIVKVPVDAEGNELNDKFETKEFAGADAFASAESTESAFAAGNAVEVANELDQDSSTQQFHGRRSAWYWNTPWYPGKLLGRGLWWGRNPYRTSFGFNYGYGHYRNYNYGGCNYYVYRRGYGF